MKFIVFAAPHNTNRYIGSIEADGPYTAAEAVTDSLIERGSIVPTKDYYSWNKRPDSSVDIIINDKVLFRIQPEVEF